MIFIHFLTKNVYCKLSNLQNLFIIIYNIIKNYKILLIFVVKLTILYKKYIYLKL